MKLPHILHLCGALLVLSMTFGQDGCVIRYQYDATGNRVSRDWYCWTGDPDPDGHGEDGMAQEGGSGQLKEQQEGPLAAVHMAALPNPSNDFVDLKLTGEVDGLQAEVADAAGHVLLTKSFAGSSCRIDVSSLAPGNYYARVRTSVDMLFTTFVVVRP